VTIAERLGALKVIPLNRNKNTFHQNQELSYLFILDFESTCWKDKSASFPPEIIEFPVVLLDLNSGEIVSEFQEYVMPTEHPRLTSFCTELTGITQETVDNGMPLKTCLLLFNKWIKKVLEDFKLSATPTENSKSFTCCTWSDWDLNLCLENECKRKQLKKPEELKTWIDIRAVYKEFYQRKPQGLNGALRDLGVEFQGRQHSGIEDARNTSKLVWKLVQDGCRLSHPQSKELIQGNPQATEENPQPAAVKKRYYGNRIYNKASMADVKIQAPTF